MAFLDGLRSMSVNDFVGQVDCHDDRKVATLTWFRIGFLADGVGRRLASASAGLPYDNTRIPVFRAEFSRPLVGTGTHVAGLGFRFWDLGFPVSDFGSRAPGFGLRVSDLVFEIPCLVAAECRAAVSARPMLVVSRLRSAPGGTVRVMAGSPIADVYVRARASSGRTKTASNTTLCVNRQIETARRPLPN